MDRSPPSANFITTKKNPVTGDGTNIEKHLHVVNFGFTLLVEGDLAGNHCVAIIKEPEKYDSLQGCAHSGWQWSVLTTTHIK